MVQLSKRRPPAASNKSLDSLTSNEPPRNREQTLSIIARARHAHERARDVIALPVQRREEAKRALHAAQDQHVSRYLASIPIGRLRETTGGALRLGALESAGYYTVADVLAVGPERLLHIQGVGPHTARHAVGAARQLAVAAADAIQIRLDPDERSRVDTALIAALRALDDADRALGMLLGPSKDFADAVEPLLAEAAPAGSRIRMLFKGPRGRKRARTAIAALDHFMTEQSRIESTIIDAVSALDRPVTNEAELWKDYERRAAEYNGLIAEIGGLGLDLDKSQGFLPEEVAEAVNAQTLDSAFLNVSLRGYQAFGAKFALVQKKSIIGDEMGLGKTVEALAAIAHLASLGSKHFLVVCPASVLVNWTHEIQRHTHLDAVRLHGPNRAYAFRRWLELGGVAVTTFGSLGALELSPEFQLPIVVVDEAHFIKNPSARRTKVTRAWMQQSDRVIFLTGTPMENRVEEFRNLVGYLQPEVARTVEPRHGIAGPIAFRRAVAPVYLRRNQADVLVELPEKLEMEDWVTFGDADGAAYRDAVEAGNFMAMRQAAFVPRSLKGSAKLTRLAEIIDESEANGWKVVVFSYFLNVLDAVSAMVGPNVLGPITGSVVPTRRQQMIDEFTSIDGHAVLVCQIEAGGVGLNIQAGSVVILTEPQWKPSTEDQAVARCHRMGQVRRVRVHRLLVEDSVDERIREVLAGKRQLFADYVDRSAVTDASPDAVDISVVDAARDVATQSEAERRIIEVERARLLRIQEADAARVANGAVDCGVSEAEF